MILSFDCYLRDVGRDGPLSREEEIRLARRCRAGDRAARNRLVRSNLKFVIAIAKEYAGPHVNLCELVSGGNLGLLAAVERFDPDRGARLVTYAKAYIRKGVQEALIWGTDHRAGRGLFVSLQDPLAKRDRTMSDIVADRAQPLPGSGLLQGELLGALEDCMAELPGREAEIIRLYFGLSGCSPVTLGAIGARIGVSSERVRQLRDRGIARLRAGARRRGLEGAAACRSGSRPAPVSTPPHRVVSK